ADTTDPVELEAKYEKQFAEDEWYRHLYRTSHAYHGVHPFYMWYWGSHGMQHVGKVIIVGGDPRAVRRLGFSPASTLQDALEMASDVVGRDTTITHLHNPPLVMADVSGARGPRCCASCGRRPRCRSPTRPRPRRAGSSRCRRSGRSARTTTPAGPAATRPAW